jgi:hypothetical protein
MVEKKNRTIMEIVKTISTWNNLLAYLWDEVVETANYIINCFLTKELKNATLFEKFTSMKPNLSSLHIYGCTAWIHILQHKYSKLEKKAICTILIGYDSRTKGYR